VAILSAADVQAALDPQDYLHLFDRNRDGAVSGTDLTWLAGRIAAAESEATMRVRAALPGGFTADDGTTVDPAVKDQLVAMVCYLAARLNPLASGQVASPFRQAYLDALGFFDRLGRDDRNRQAVGNPALAAPVAVASNVTDAAGDYTDTYSRAADRRDASLY
jgi:hypothetical protein